MVALLIFVFLAAVPCLNINTCFDVGYECLLPVGLFEETISGYSNTYNPFFFIYIRISVNPNIYFFQMSFT